ncbi:MAG: alkaline phosphatase, partial [Chloroflexota bacterium]
DPWGNRDDERGIVQFVVGTGGRSSQQFRDILAYSLRRGTAYGVLKLTLHSTWFEWQFLPVRSEQFMDYGTANCHD